MAALISFGFRDPPSIDGTEAGTEHDQFENIFERTVEGSETAFHDRLEKGQIQALAYEIDGAEAQHNETPEYEDMYDTRSRIAGLPLLDNSVDKHINKPLSDICQPRIGLA